MNEQLTVRIDDVLPQDWDAFMAWAPSGHLLQTWAWGDLKAEFGWRPVRIAVERDGEIAAAAQMLLRRSPLGPFAYIPKGPVLDPLDAAVSRALVEAIHRAARRQRAILVKVEPDRADTPEARRWLAEMGFRRSRQTIQPRRTILVDLTRDEETILKEMKSKTRYNIRLASRRSVSVREGTADDLDAFYQLMRTTGQRDGFGIHSRDYYAQAWRRFRQDDRVKLLLAVYRDALLAGEMVFSFGRKAWYMYGASSNEHRNLMPNYLLRWEAMRLAKGKGCQTYDLWGIPDLDEEVLEATIRDEEQPHPSSSALWGLYRPKRGFGGQHVRYVGAYDFPYRATLYRLLTWLWEKRRGMGE